MTAPSRIDNDTTTMMECPSCCGPTDIYGRASATDYIHRVEHERQQAEDVLQFVLLALEPFAAMANRYGADHPDATTVLTWQDKPVVSLGDLRRAKQMVDQY